MSRKAEFVGAGGVIRDRRLDGIAGVAQIDEVGRPLDHAGPFLDVEAGNDADLETWKVLPYSVFQRSGTPVSREENASKQRG